MAFNYITIIPAVVALLIFVCAQNVYAYQTGAPSEACSDMTPQHGVSAQSSTAPYKITTSSPTVASGDTVQVTIEGVSPTDLIKGFMVQARVGKDAVGTWKIPSSDADFTQTLDCGGKNTAVTHTYANVKNPKHSKVFTWVAPANLKGLVIFTSTIALNGGVFWTRIPANAIEVV